MVAHNESVKIPSNIKIFINYLLKRFMEKNNNIIDEEYEKTKHLYEIDVNK